MAGVAFTEAALDDLRHIGPAAVPRVLKKVIPLAQVVQRLGRFAQVAEVPIAPPRDPVPDWLADRLIHTARLRREQVAGMDLRQALEAWTAYVTGQR